ncbi:hypothetical protein SAMN05216276_106249 [Streptosporangium subroseum]|uniref:Condensation domain-containing protein n=1 Tax=Streptosporangium subroseum TaxID=106412 RepID=A0A239NLZ7_9ACTN|nr:hypothetical protein [Streptosporangium subroseum]SNT55885.1 hypothetical protein SAMN05216276_106249 [Streptosporangium subroseum]
MTESEWSPSSSVIRSGRLTWAQQEWVHWVPTDTDTSFEDNICAVIPGRDVPVDHVVTAVRDVLVRHEGLRSLVHRAGQEGSRQYVCPVDERLDDVIQVTDEDVAGRRRFDTPWRRTCFRIGAEWPIKVVLYATGGLARRIDIVVDHVAIDPWGMRVLCDDLTRAIRSRAVGREPFGAERTGRVEGAEQPIDVALSETSPAGLVYQRRALGYWEQRLLGFRKALDGHTPRSGPSARPRSPSEQGAFRFGKALDGHTPPPPTSEQGAFRSCWLVSRRAGQAAGAIARATGVSPSAAFLLAFGTAVCAVERSPQAGLFAISANRFSAGARRSVRKATMTMPVLVPAPARGDAADSYRRALADCAAQQLYGHRFANADPYATERMCEEILEDLYKTGVAYPRFSYMDDSVTNDFNPVWPAEKDGFPGDVTADDRTVTFTPPRPLGARYMLTVLHRRAGAVLSLQWGDATGWGETAESMLLHIEDLMVWAASEYALDAPVFGQAGTIA